MNSSYFSLISFQTSGPILVVQLTLIKPQQTESTAVGVAMMAGLGKGIFLSLDEIKLWQKKDWKKEPQCHRNNEYEAWLMAVEKTCL